MEESSRRNGMVAPNTAGVMNYSDEKAAVGTLSIDLNDLLGDAAGETGSFNLRRVETGALGALLDALPLPAFLVDERHCVVFSNNYWRKHCGLPNRVCHTPFTDLIACSGQPEAAENVPAQASAALEKAFLTRKPVKLETIVRIGAGRKWARLHLRAVRIEKRRCLLIVMEDITAERSRQRLGRIEEQRLRRLYRELQAEARNLQAQLDDVFTTEIRIESEAM
jgi:PAS domain-containing protein